MGMYIERERERETHEHKLCAIALGSGVGETAAAAHTWFQAGAGAASGRAQPGLAKESRVPSQRNVYDAWQAHKFTHEKLRIPPQSTTQADDGAARDGLAKSLYCLVVTVIYGTAMRAIQ